MSAKEIHPSAKATGSASSAEPEFQARFTAVEQLVYSERWEAATRALQELITSRPAQFDTLFTTCVSGRSKLCTYFALIMYYCAVFPLYVCMLAFLVVHWNDKFGDNGNISFSSDAGQLGGPNSRVYGVGSRAISHGAECIFQLIFSPLGYTIILMLLMIITTMLAPSILNRICKKLLLLLGFRGSWQVVTFGERLFLTFVVPTLLAFVIGVVFLEQFLGISFVRSLVQYFLSHYFLVRIAQAVLFWPLLRVFLAGVISRDSAMIPRHSLGGTIFHFAAAKGCVDFVNLLLENGTNVNAIDEDGRTALHLAVRNSHCNVAETTIRYGIDIGAKTTFTKETALHVAVACSESSMIDLLLSNGALINARNSRELTPLALAYKLGLGNIASSLKSRGGVL